MLNIFKNKKLQETVIPTSEANIDLPPNINEREFLELYNLCRPFTMTSAERMYSLYKAVYYILQNNIPGDFTECGVWKGGSALLIAGVLIIDDYGHWEGCRKAVDEYIAENNLQILLNRIDDTGRIAIKNV